MSQQFPVKGLAELDKFLSALPRNLETGAYRAGLRAGGNVVRDKAREKARKQSGKMAKAIKTGSPRKNQDGTFSVKVSLKGPHAYVGLFSEYGVARHLIARTGSKEGRVAVRKAKEGRGTIQGGVMKIGDDFVSGIIEHPGHRAHPFMRPALEETAEEVVKAMAVRMSSYLEGKSGFAMPMGEAA